MRIEFRIISDIAFGSRCAPPPVVAASAAESSSEDDSPSEAVVEPFAEAAPDTPPLKRTLIPVEDIDTPEGAPLFGAVTVSPGAFNEQVD